MPPRGSSDGGRSVEGDAVPTSQREGDASGPSPRPRKRRTFAQTAACQVTGCTTPLDARYHKVRSTLWRSFRGKRAAANQVVAPRRWPRSAAGNEQRGTFVSHCRCFPLVLQKYRICAIHMMSPEIVFEGHPSRFCQKVLPTVPERSEPALPSCSPLPPAQQLHQTS
jgi:hypothetical protein